MQKDDHGLHSTRRRAKSKEEKLKASISTKRDASWPLVLFYIHLYILGLYGLLVLYTNTAIPTIIFTILLSFVGVLGCTAGTHRLWAHQSYKANTFLRFLLMICQTLAGQGSIYDWVQLHRLHHKTFKTEDDPFYSTRDFLSAHLIANIRNLSEKQETMLAEIDMEDIENDRIVMFQKRFYWLLYTIVFCLLPINAPMEYWGDSVAASVFVVFSLRYLIVSNICCLINSAHFIWGLDKNNKPSDSNMIFLVTKTYWPHYHYVITWDYLCGEFGDYGEDITTIGIRIFAALGWANELKTISSNAVKKSFGLAVNSEKKITECLAKVDEDDVAWMPDDHQ